MGYFGDVLSFAGTVVLGYIAIAQTEKANQMNKELLEIEKNRIKPCVDITSTELSNIYFGESMRKKLQENSKRQIISGRKMRVLAKYTQPLWSSVCFCLMHGLFSFHKNST